MEGHLKFNIIINSFYKFWSQGDEEGPHKTLHNPKLIFLKTKSKDP